MKKAVALFSVIISSRRGTSSRANRAVASYWYYCADAKAYYPYVQQCPAGWLRVIPETTPPQSIAWR